MAKSVCNVSLQFDLNYCNLPTTASCFSVADSRALLTLLCRAYDGTLLVGVLPVATFCSGHTIFVQRMPQRHHLQPYVTHATFQYSGTPGKRHRLREALIWNVSHVIGDG